MKLIKDIFCKNKISTRIFKRNYNVKISLIVCTDMRGGISKNETIPWSIKEDINFFYDITTKKNNNNNENAIIMGKKTWMSLPDNSRGFKNRNNIVLSSILSQDELNKTNFTGSKTWVVNSLDNAMKLVTHMGINNVFIGGGAKVYKQALQKFKIDNIYLTTIFSTFGCDSFFPLKEFNNWRDQQNIYNQTKRFQIIDNKNNKPYSIFFDKNSTSPQTFVNFEETNYLNLMERIINQGRRGETRNGTTMSIFGDKLEFNLSKGFPLLTTKKVSLYNIFHELMFFIRGQTNTNILKDHKINIWNNNTSRIFLDSVGLNHYSEGDMGPMYGFQWRFNNALYKGCHTNYYNQGIDQLKHCLELIKYDPHSRRIVMTTFNPNQANEGCLFPCHGVFIQFYIEGSKLSCMMTQRSADIFLGLPYNVASYALLTHMICEVVNNDELYKGPQLSPGRLIISIGDAHLYQSHYSQAIRQILREPTEFPKLKFNRKVSKIEDFIFDDLNLIEYDPYPNITAKMVA